MVFSEIMMLAERGLNDGPTNGMIYSLDAAKHIRIIATTFASLSILADIATLYWFIRMKRKWRHTLIVTLIAADLLKDVNYLSFTAFAFIEKHVVSQSHYCQASGFFQQYLVEVTDFVIVTIVTHMSVQIINPSPAGESEGGLERWKGWIFTAILGLPFIMACVAFSNSNGGYQLIGAFCGLPVRPFWYRLTLSWIPRYIIAVAIIVLTIVIRIRVKGYQKKLAQLQPDVPTQGQLEEGIIEEEADELSSDDGDINQEKPMSQQTTSIDEKRQTYMSTTEIPPVPAIPTEHQQFNSDDLRKFKRMSYKRRQLPPINTADSTRGGSIAPSVAPSSAVFVSPTRADFPDTNRNSTFLAEQSEAPPMLRRKSVADLNPRRSQSVIDVPLPNRRASVIESTPRGGSVSRNSFNQPLSAADRMSSIHSTGRRSSIWDEIDASLDKKMAHRISIFTINASEAGDVEGAPVTYESDNVAISARNSMVGHPNPLGQNRVNPAVRRQSVVSSGRGSMIYSTARRAMSIISFRGNEEQEVVEGPEAILQRRHRFIQRQLRYLMFYPVLYLLLWACPFLLHVLQYNDKFAVRPPFAIAVLNIVSMTIFGFVNSVVFCMREKPWTMIEGSDGTLVGSLRTCPFYLFFRRCWWSIRGRRYEEEEGDDLDFEG
ncbi:hypothetical protein C1H76_8873 [Elsinoe australis]|uniref:G protein-coupled receptor GPR1 n=1 Tax=Elsinoe australis TaxID=40998 RepID=A0A4U7ATP5_9PEZI|nr:hypothetical protein C1H76_8873 [Elsinoe australis]